MTIYTDENLGYAVEHCGQTKPAMPDTVNKLKDKMWADIKDCATRKDFTKPCDKCSIGLNANGDCRLDAALPLLQSLLPLVDDMEGAIRRVLKRLQLKGTGDCKECPIEIEHCLSLCVWTDDELDSFAALLTAELMAPKEEKPI